MLINFESHDVTQHGEEIEITLYLSTMDFEFAKEITKKHSPESKDMNESILEYIKINLPNFKNAIIKVVSGSILVCSVSLISIQNAIAEEEISQKAMEEAKLYSPEISIWIDDRKEEFEQKPLLIEDRIFLPLRELAEKLGTEVQWEEEEKEAVIKGKEFILQIQMDTGRVWKDGEEGKAIQTVTLENRIYVPLRFFSESMGYYVQWDQESKSVFITEENLMTKEKKVVTYGEKVSEEIKYKEEDLYWLSRLVHAEAQGESYDGKLAVANVIINRVKNPDFPDSIKKVIFDTKHGVQFIPTINGALYNIPGEESIRAAKAALAGQDNSKGTLYFVNPAKATNRWIMNHRRWAFAIGEHHFYY